MSIRSARLSFIIASMLLIVVVLGFTGGLNIASFKENYTRSLESSYKVVAREAVKKIEYAVRYGKPLTNFYGMEEILGDIQSFTPSIEEVRIVLPEGEVIYDQRGPVNGQTLSDYLYSQVYFDPARGADAGYIAVLEQGKYHMFLPIMDMNGEWIGSLGVKYDESVVKALIDSYTKKLLLYLLLFALIAAACLTVFIMKAPILTEDGQIRKRRLLISFLIVLGLVQIAYGSLNYIMLKKGYLDSIKENTSVILQIIQQDIHSVLDKGVPYSRLYGVGDYMGKIIEDVPEVDRISVIDADFTTARFTGESFESAYTYSVPLAADSLGRGNFISIVDLSVGYINGKMREIMLDTLTMLVVSVFLMVEITLFVLWLMRRKVSLGNASALSEFQNDRTIIRPLSFIVFAAAFMSLAFIPMYMKELYKPVFGLSESVVLGLPLSAEGLLLALSSVFAGYMIDKRGWKPVFMIGLGILGVATLLSGLAWDAYSFIAARGLSGAGYGFALMAMQAFVISAPNEAAKNEALTELNSGALAGMNCGVVIGGMLADRIGFAQVYFIAFFLVVGAALFALKFTINYVRQNRREEPAVPAVVPSVASGQRSGEMAKLWNFFANLNIFSFFVLVLIPISIGGMFLVYFFPVLAEMSGISPSNTSRAFLLHGLCVIYLGPLLSYLSEKYLGTKRSIIAGAAIVALALFIYAGSGTLMAAFIAILLLGVAEGFGITAQINYYISRKESVELGEEKSMGYYNLVENIGQTLGPILFGSAILLGMAAGVGLIGILIVVTLVVFLLLTGRERKMSVNHNQGAGGIQL